MDSKKLLYEQFNEAIQVWQNSMMALPKDESAALNTIILNNKKFAEMMSDAVSNYINNISVQIVATTNFGTSGGDVVVPWSSPTYVSLSNSGNHAYIQNADANGIYIETGRLAGREQYKRYLSTPKIIRI